MKWNVETFIKYAQAIYGTEYDYSKVQYVDRNTHVVITCPIHGDFKRTPLLHLHRKIGCGKCGKIKASTSRRVGQEKFIKRLVDIHGTKYDYSKVEYVNNSTKVMLICDIHGEFLIRPSDVMHYHQGCHPCGVYKSCRTRSWKIHDFIKQANIIHSNFYDYSKTIIFNSSTKVNITCPNHGEFWMLPGNHIHRSQGCKSCNAHESKTERYIRTIFKKHNIDHVQQKTYDKLIGKGGHHLRYDFYLPHYNTIIEYDGEQHYLPIFGEARLQTCREHDKIKNLYANEHSIKLIRIPYWERDHIELIIKQTLHIA